MDAVIKNTRIAKDYDLFKDTSWAERTRLNCYQFAAAKDLSECMALREMVLTTENYKEFYDKAKEIVDLNRDQYFRVEYDSAERSAVMGEAWRGIEDTKDIYPYWVYHGMMDDRERDEHIALEGLVFRIGDPEGDSIFPPIDWNCRCTGDPADDSDIPEGQQVAEGNDYLTKDDPDTGEPYVDEAFRYNPADQVVPNEGSYFDVLKDVNKSDSELFDFDE